MKRKILGISLVLILLFVFAGQSFAQSQTPTEALKRAVDRLLKILDDPYYEEHKQERQESIEQVIDDIFDFRQLSAYCVGKKLWKSFNKDQQNEFVTVFTEFLKKKFLNEKIVDKIKQGRKNIQYTDEEIKGRAARVFLDLSYESFSFLIEVRMKRHEDTWRIYNIGLESGALILSKFYRAQFEGKTAKEAIKIVKEKLKEGN